MLEFFKRHTFFSLLLLIPYAVALHLSPLLVAFPSAQSEQLWLFNLLILHGFAPGTISNHVFSLMLIIFQAAIIGYIVSKFKLVPEGQLFPSIAFLLLVGMNHVTLELSAVLIANLFFTIGLLQLFNIYQKKQAAFHLFNFGSLMGIATLFYTPYVYFLLVAIVAQMILRGFKPRETLQFIGGFANIFILTYFVLYFLELDSEFFHLQWSRFFSPFIFSMKFQSTGWVPFAIAMLVVVVAIANYSYFQMKRGIAIQKLFDLLFWCLVISFLGVCFLRIDTAAHLIMLYTPLALLGGMLLTKLKNPLIAETFHLFLIMICLFLQFQNW